MSVPLSKVFIEGGTGEGTTPLDLRGRGPRSRKDLYDGQILGSIADDQAVTISTTD